jgi:hypothetical protein
MIKSSNAIQQHMLLIKQMEATYGDVLVRHAASFFDPAKPAFFRTVLRRRDYDSNASLVSQMTFDLHQRVLMHDRDKLDIARYVESIQEDDPSREARYEGAEARYRSHDLNRDHHAACWVTRASSLHCTSFIEHLLDHAAVNALHGERPFDLEQLRRAGAFYDKRVDTKQGFVTDLELYFNTDSFVMKHLIEKTVEQYTKLIGLFLPALELCNKAAER